MIVEQCLNHWHRNLACFGVESIKAIMTFVRMTEKNQNDVFSNYRKVEISAIKHVYRLSVQSFSINLIEDLCHNGLKKNQGFKNKLMFDSSLNTYAISLQFPQDVNQIISSR